MSLFYLLYIESVFTGFFLNCRGSPDSCFCKEGTCKEEKWECHESIDCLKLAKCNGKNCTCTYGEAAPVSLV